SQLDALSGIESMCWRIACRNMSSPARATSGAAPAPPLALLSIAAVTAASPAPLLLDRGAQQLLHHPVGVELRLHDQHSRQRAEQRIERRSVAAEIATDEVRRRAAAVHRAERGRLPRPSRA